MCGLYFQLPTSNEATGNINNNNNNKRLYSLDRFLDDVRLMLICGTIIDFRPMTFMDLIFYFLVIPLVETSFWSLNYKMNFVLIPKLFFLLF